MSKHRIIKCHVKKKTTDEFEDMNTIAPSAELLRSTLSISFFSISIVCVIISVGILLLNLIIQYWFSALSIVAIINSIVVIFQGFLTISYFHGLQSNLLINTRIILQLSSVGTMLVCFLLLGFNDFIDYQPIFSGFATANLAVILFAVFFSIYKEISTETNKDYIVNYFSALTAFAALIVSLVALFKNHSC